MSAYLIAGVLAVITDLLTFLVIHHSWIRPIWFIPPTGLFMSTIGGLTLGWSYAEPHLRRRPGAHPTHPPGQTSDAKQVLWENRNT